MADRTCNATKDDGSPCESPFVGEDGFCPAHRPGGREKLREAAKKGGEVTRKRFKAKALGADELPALTSAQAAETWCDKVGRAVVTGRLSHNQAQAALRAVREWRESHESGRMSERFEALTDALSRWKETGDPEPVLELVKAGS